MPGKHLVGLMLGPVLFGAILAVPLPQLSPRAHALAAVFVWTATYWVTDAPRPGHRTVVFSPRGHPWECTRPEGPGVFKAVARSGAQLIHPDREGFDLTCRRDAPRRHVRRNSNTRCRT